MGESQLAEKARELHTQILRLEGEKYDLEKRFKQLQVEVNSHYVCLRQPSVRFGFRRPSH